MTSDGFHTYTYDAEGNIAAVDNGGTVSYVYDAMNRKVHAQFPSSTAEYLYDVSNRITTVWPSPTFSNESHQFWDGRQLTLRSGDGRTYFVHTDAVMTDRVHTDPNGNAAATFTSLPFGDEGHVSDSDSYATWDFYRFGDQDWDSESNTDRALFRQYSPTQGRWFSPDPYQGSYDPSNPQSFNRYAYVLNSPLSFIDPLGFCVTPGVIFCINGWAPYLPPDGGAAAGTDPGIPLIRREPDGGAGAPSNNNPFKEWPLNGNITPATYQQDQKCSAGPVIGPAMDSLPGVKAACQWHDNKYIEYNCNATSWISPFPGPCKGINYMLLIKIYNALPVRPF